MIRRVANRSRLEWSVTVAMRRVAIVFRLEWIEAKGCEGDSAVLRCCGVTVLWFSVLLLFLFEASGDSKDYLGIVDVYRPCQPESA